ncbi:MAG: hypothetical protein PUB94_04965 [Oscillospiraceae bacterium]|nr:hypothetical protein [Oscillospiraceae bacterium]
MEAITKFFQSLYEAIMKIFDVNIDADGEKRTLFDKIKEALDNLFA